ncbi:MAG: prolyl oligopeptidase family serine peptidase [Cytophagales bacterium]|nr:prolyl oligopeptidase family serine peptidase [Cytophagales bacterium]
MKRILILLFAVFSITVHAQKRKPASSAPTPKKVLSHTDYDSWKEITYKSLTPDGAFACYTVNPQDGDGQLFFYNTKTGARDSAARAENISLAFDSRFAVFKVKPPQGLVKDLRRQKKKKEDLPRDTLGVYSFLTRAIEKIPEVKSFRLPEKQGGWLAYLKEAPREDKGNTQDKSAKSKKGKKFSEENGHRLVLRNLTTRKENVFDFVKDYTFAKFGQGLLFVGTGNDSTTKAGVYWYDLQKETLQVLYEGKSKYRMKGLSISEDGKQVAFLVDPDTTKALVRRYQLHHWKEGDARATLMDVERSMGIPQNWIVSENYTPYFSKNGARLFFGSSPIPIVQDTTRLTEEIVQVEVWGGEDDYIYPQQNKQLDTERKRAYVAVIDLVNRNVMQLGDREVPSVEMGEEGNAPVVLGETNVPYRKMITWDPSAYTDFYLFDLQKQVRTTVARGVKGNASLSPKAGYVYWFSLPDTAWNSYSVADGKTTVLTKDLPVLFANEENDEPDYPGAYGSAGWTEEDKLFIAYDRYDLWALDPSGNKPPVNLTKIGRQEKIVFRYVKLDPEERFIQSEKEILLSAFQKDTKASGYYKLSLKDGKLTRLIMDDFRFGGLSKAKKSDRLLFTRESFREFPDVWTSNLDFAGPRKISQANPQMKKYAWGTVETVSWVSNDNVPLNGLLYKPEGFDPKKKYPMIVYFYERESDNLHAHIPPTPLRSTINRTTYVSDGYMVFVPDIQYKIGFPGESALNCIMPGITSLLVKGFVDEKNIGIQGHSWGGYQTAYLITRTDLFKAAEAGAIVANMTSAYGGIRWGSGLSRMFQYEHSQSRIGGTLWEKPLHYIENSPLFFADKIKTPLLLLHNDADDAVPWYQGIEMYLAMRRLNKPVWMLNYNGEPHWPVKRENRMDFQIRMKQFFDFYLKGAAQPDWMKEGVPAIEKGIEKGY